MQLRAFLAKTTTDSIKSKIKTNQLAEVVLECYMNPKEFAELITQFEDKELSIEIK